MDASDFEVVWNVTFIGAFVPEDDDLRDRDMELFGRDSGTSIA